MAEDWARPVVHWEIYAKDQDKIRSFYREMFNWKIADGPIAAVDAGIGGPPPEGFTGHILPGDTSRVVIDIQVLAGPSPARPAHWGRRNPIVQQRRSHR